VLTAAAGTGNTYQWTNNGALISGATSNVYSANASGSYALIVTNAAGCSVTSSSTPVSVVLASVANITASGSTSLCNNASVTLSATSGASYLWSNGATTQAITVSTAANYTVIVTNASGCSATSVATPVIVNASPAATITAGGATTFCQGGNVVLTASAGATYLWSNGATTSTITASTPGTYSVLITNASGCSATSAGSTITVNAAPNASITASGNTTFCSGGSVTLTASPGASYLWSTGATTASISATTAGARTVTVTNAAGCSSTSTATTIVVNAMPTATITAAGPTTICSGSNVTLTASAGSSYLWNNGATTSSIVANTSGNYTVTVYNANGCSAISTPTTITVNNPSVANIATSGSTTFCTGGSVNLTATAASSYLWSTGATTQTISVNTTGNYTVVLTNASGCTSTSPVTTVTANALPTVAITAGGPTTFCQGGSVNLTASAATSYVWSNGATTASVNITAPGSYTVQISNSTGCTVTSTATVVAVNALPTASITASGNTNLCAGANVTLTASAGSTYLWSTGATTASIVVTTAGSSTVTVTNAAGCSSTSSPTNIVVNALPTPSITSIGSTTICQGATVTLTTANGTGLTYQWKNNGTNIPGATSVSHVANAVGSYTVQVTNAAGCIGTSIATAVVVNALPVASISNSGANTICAGTSVNLTASGGTAYVWSNGATSATIAANTTGNYTVSVSNAAGCTSTASTAISVLTPTVASISANGPTSFCAGQNVVLTANAGASYVWSTGATTASITVAATNNVSVQVTYASGCVSTSPVTSVTANSLPAATISASGATSFCPGSTVTLTASNGATYLWTNGATTNSIVVSSTGNYGVTVANAAGCTATSLPTSVDVFVTPTATITSSGATTFCQGATINLTANAGAAYAWSSGETTASIAVTSTGNFTVTVTNANGCSAVSSLVPVTVNAVPVASIQANGPTTVCQGTSVVLTANGGTGFAWSNAETSASISVTTTGSYGVTVTNAAGCSSVVTPVSITVNPVQVLSPIVGASNVCVGASTTYTNSTSGGVWISDNTAVATVNSTSGNVSGISTGSATIKYQFVNASGCTSEVTSVITVNGIQPISIATSGSTSFCQGGSVTLTAPAGLNYNWTNGQTTQSITVNSSGTFALAASNAAGCFTTSSTVVVTMNPAPVVNITSTSTTLCQGSNLVLNAPANAASYAWSNGATTQNILINTPGTYSLTLTDANGCSASTNTTIVNGINPQASISAGGATTFCQGGNVVLNAAGGTSFLWNNGATTQNISVTTPGNYSVTVTNAAGCSSLSNSTIVNVLQAPVSVATAYGSTTFCQGGSVIIATSGGTSYVWSNGSTAQSILPTTSGSYSVITTGANGCTATSNAINVTVNPTPTAVISPSGATTFCEGSSVNLVASGGVSYAWNNGSTAATLAASTGGVYTVTVTNAGGCTDTETMTVTVNEVPSAFIVTSGATTFCEGGEVSLTAQAGNTYVWSNSATTQAIAVSTAGTYSVTILSPNGCSVTSNAITVDVNQPSASNLIATAFDGYTLNGILYTQSGTYTQTLTNAAGCDSTITLDLTLTVGIEEGTITDVNLYPNPTSESFTIKTSVVLYGNYSVVDAQGKLVFEGEMTGTETQVNISSVARGIYYLRIPELSEPLRVVKN
jgi:predicted transcriptional regulator